LARLLQKYGESEVWKKELPKYEEQGEDMIAFRPEEEEEGEERR
jgi:hypothetical protein